MIYRSLSDFAIHLTTSTIGEAVPFQPKQVHAYAMFRLQRTKNDIIAAALIAACAAAPDAGPIPWFNLGFAAVVIGGSGWLALWIRGVRNRRCVAREASERTTGMDSGTNHDRRFAGAHDS